MTTPRWDKPWVTPVGSAPERPPGEPSPALIAVVQLAALLALGGVGSLITAVAPSSELAAGVSALVLAALSCTAGEAAWRRQHPLSDWVGDLLQAAAVVYLFGGAAVLARRAGAADHEAALWASLVALGAAGVLYLRHQRIWLQIACVAAAGGALLAGLSANDETPDAVYGAYLLVLASFTVLGALSGVFRPVRSGYVLAALLAAAGSQVLVSADTLLGGLVTAVVLALVAVGVVRSSNRSLLPVSLVAGVVLIPQVLSPVVGTAQAISLSMVGVAAVTAWLALDLSMRAVRPMQVGGVFAACTGFVVLGSIIGAFGDDHVLSGMLQAIAVAAFFGAAATARRRPAMVISGLIVVNQVPDAFGDAVQGGDAVRGLVSLAAFGLAVLVAIRLGRRSPRPVGAPDQQEIGLSGRGEEWTVVGPYPQVFDGVVAILSTAGVALQVVDRAAGRVIAGDPVSPLLVVALWATDPVRTHVRAAGSPAAVEQLRRDLAARTGTSSLRG